MAGTRHLGIDLGATNLKWSVVEHDGDAWAVVAQDSVPTRAAGDPEGVPAAVVAQMAEVAETANEAWGPLASVGIGVPGLYDPLAGTVRLLVNLPGPWAGHPVAASIMAATGLPVALINDARAFGLAELRLGAARGASSMVGLTLGTGVGGVIAVDGRVHQGHDGTAGELGHQVIDPAGPPCGCGSNGCLEAYARADRIAAACGTAGVPEAVAAAQAGNARAIAGLAEIGRHLAIGIANMITVIAPDVVVIGGGVAQAGPPLFDPLLAELRSRVRMTSLDDVSIVLAELGTWAGSIGAAVHGAERVGLA